MRSRLPLFALLALLTAAGCRDAHDPISPPAPLAPTAASPAISDGAHGGNPYVFFLPPLVKQPTSSGTFNPSLFPLVRIDRSLDGSNWTTIRTFARSAGEIVIPSGAEHFQVDWNTAEQPVDYLSIYRIQIFARETPTGPELPLALVDVQFAATGKEARNVSTSEVVGLVDGRTLPIRFWIQHNALVAAMEAAGECGAPGSGECGEIVVRSGVTTPFLLPSGFAAAEFGPDAIHPSVQAVTATIARHNPFTEGPCLPTAVTDLQQAEGCYEYNTDPYLPYGFGRDLEGNGSPALVRVEVCLDRSREPEEYRLFKYSPRRDPQLQELPRVPALLVKCESFATSTQKLSSRGGWLRGLTRAGGTLLGPLAAAAGVRPLYATDTGEGGMTGSFSPSRIGWGRPLAVAVYAGDGQTGEVGSTLQVAPTVSVTAGSSGEGHEPTPAASVPVQWTVTGGGGSVGAATTFTDAAGLASVPWTLGSTAGTNTLSARVPGGATVSFTATAVDGSTIR